MRTLDLDENSPKERVRLSTAERDALRRVAPSIVVTPSVGMEGHYDLKPGSWIGAIHAGSLRIVIRPKLPINRVLYLLSFAHDRVRWNDVDFEFDEDSSLYEAIVAGFVAQLDRAFHKGKLQGYQSREEALPRLRGQVRIDEQVRRHFGVLPPVEVRYDEYSDDFVLNRLLKSAIRRLRCMPIRSAQVKKSICMYDSVLEGVALADYSADQVPNVTYDHLNLHYRPAVELAKLVLRSTSFDLRHGSISASAFLTDMNLAFQDFVATSLQNQLRLSERAFRRGGGGRTLYLDDAETIRLDPDLTWWEGGNCMFVGDVKYKATRAKGARNSDIYQLLAYTVAAGLPKGMLIYAAGEAEPRVHDISVVGKHLEVVTLDVSPSHEAIQAQIAALADKVRTLRDERMAQLMSPIADGERV